MTERVGAAGSQLVDAQGVQELTAAGFAPVTLGLVRVACVSPELRVADVRSNVREIVAALASAADLECQLALFPELCVTGYPCGDLFHQRVLLDGAVAAVREIRSATATNAIAAVVGLPVEVAGRLYNCAVLIADGKVLGIVPKTYLPSTNEFYEERWFSSARDSTGTEIVFDGDTVPFGADLLFAALNMPSCVVGVEICEDLWAVQPPSGTMALAGATVLLNLSASNELLGKAEYRKELVKQQSARCQAAYLYAAAGPGESSTDLVYSGHCIVAEYGSVLAESGRFQFATQITSADIDVQRLTHERIRSSAFSSGETRAPFRQVAWSLPRAEIRRPLDAPLRRPVSATPFVPDDASHRDSHCEEVFSIQCTGLATRLRHLGMPRVVIGISGGLDSTLALLVVRRAFAILGLDPSGIIGVTMPGFGTTNRTHANAMALAGALGVTVREIAIRDAVLQHFADIGHDQELHDVTYENAQARERTQILMDIANDVGGITVGTGDLSELALGWCTYNGDQMSMYHVNAGVPKTLVCYIIEWCADREFTGDIAGLLRDISATPISPELLLLGDGEVHDTEALVGPYLLHDFFLYYAVRHCFSPAKIYALARQAFAGQFDDPAILHWMREFFRRFFANQFKRSAMPDGPKVGSVGLSPRGDWRMPSDASAAAWLDQIDALTRQRSEGSRPALGLVSTG